AALSTSIYCSFSTGVNARSAKVQDRIRAVPDDRVLIESDLHDASMVDKAMRDACEMVAGAKEWTVMEAGEKTGNNAKAFLAHF
ncbi:hypothetical protein HK104_009790, partial [Borealophlyctis nickersoniae]